MWPCRCAVFRKAQGSFELPKGHRLHTPRAPLVIGWRECVGLPEIGIDRIEAKIDTGARTSALYATDIEVFEQSGEPWVRFRVPHRDKMHASDCDARIVDRRNVKNTSGENDERLVIETMLLLDHRRWHIEVTLANRANMMMPLILGRTAIRRHRVLVDPGRSHLLRKNGPERKAR